MKLNYIFVKKTAVLSILCTIVLLPLFSSIAHAIVFDPTPAPTSTSGRQTQALVPSQDTWISEVARERNYGSENYVRLGHVTLFGTQYAYRLLLSFDLSVLPRNAEILEARLILYEKTRSGTVPAPVGNVFQVGSQASWDEDTVTWDNRPQLTTEAAPYIASGRDGSYTYYAWNTVAIVRNWINNPSTYPNYGFYVRPEQSSSSYWLDFNSREYSDRKPNLIVVYNVPEPTSFPIPRITLPTPQPTFSVRIPNLTNFFATPTPIGAASGWPEISNLSYLVTGNSVAFSWQTSVPTSSQVWYSIDDRYDHYSQFNSSSGTNHTATLSNLDPNTYHYMAVSRDANNRYAYSSRSTFTIAAQGSDAMNSEPTPAPEEELVGLFIADPAGDVDDDGVINAQDPDDDNDAIADDQDPDANGDGVIDATPAPAASAQPAPTPAVDQNSFFAKIKEAIEDEVAQQLVTARAKAQEKGKTGLFSLNPLLLATGAYGTNKTMGIIFIAASILLTLGALTLLRLSHKTAHHVKKVLKVESPLSS